MQEKKVTLVQIELKKDLTTQEDNFKERLAQRKKKLAANRSTQNARLRPLTSKAKLQEQKQVFNFAAGLASSDLSDLQNQTTTVGSRNFQPFDDDQNISAIMPGTTDSQLINDSFA